MIEPPGRRILDTIKSSRSRIVESPPKGLKPDQTLNPSAHGNARTNIPIPHMRQVFLRLIPVSSMKFAITFSYTAKAVESAAKVMNRKKNPPHSLPRAIFENTLGMVIKRRLGPELTSIPYEKHAGKIIRPAITATNVSSNDTFTASPNSLLSLLIYEPNTAIEPIPMLKVKNDWLSALMITDANPVSLILSVSGIRKNSSPSMPPFKVKDFIANTTRLIRSTAIMYLVTVSSPF